MNKQSKHKTALDDLVTIQLCCGRLFEEPSRISAIRSKQLATAMTELHSYIRRAEMDDSKKR